MSNGDSSEPGDMASLDFTAIKHALASSSTNVRISQLRSIEEKLTQKSIDNTSITRLLQLFFGTYAFYTDRQSRLSVQKCLVALISAGIDSKTIAPLIAALRKESQKHGIAPTNAFVLVEWCSLFMQHLDASVWDQFASDIILTDADALDKCHQSSARKSVAHSAIIVTRRGLRKLFSSPDSSEKRLSSSVSILATKSAQSTPRNAVLLGVIAGVSARKDHLRPVLDTLKPKYYEFFTREIIGSRTAVPGHVVLGLGDFFTSFATPEELSKEVIPALEKGLLRAPEVILGGVVTPLVRSLPENFDLSKILEQNLLKPLLSNAKSTNAAIRAGALDAFRALVRGSKDTASLEKVINEVATPLKAGKLASPDHRLLHAQMLEATPLSTPSAEQVASAVATVAAKEGNEGALAAETSALANAITFLLAQDVEVPKPVLDSVTKGLTEKKIPSRKCWLLRVGVILQSITEAQVVSPGMATFVEAVVPKMVATLTEVAANAASAAQSGLVVGAYILTAVSPHIYRLLPGSTAESCLTKASVTKQSLSLDPKSSFLLSHRIYSKVTASEDLGWFARALGSVFQSLDENVDKQVTLAWSEAFIHLVTAHSVPATIQQESSKLLSDLYVHNPRLVSTFIIHGLWDHVQHSGSGDREHSASAHNLIQVVKSICLTPNEIGKSGKSIAKEDLESQANSLLVLARSELIPRANWIDLCLRMELDPGNLVTKYQDQLMAEIEARTSFDQKVCDHRPIQLNNRALLTD
jgi:hypothetical protein